jgi:hypothetical protein
MLRRRIGATLIENGAITTDKMVVGTINADRLQSGSITTGLIAADTITASKLAIGDFTNPIDNWNFQLGDVYWFKEDTWQIAANPIAELGGFVALKTGGSTSTLRSDTFIEVQPNDAFRATARIQGIGTNGSAYVRYSYINATGSDIGFANGNLISGGAGWQDSQVNIIVPATIGSSRVFAIRLEVVATNTTGTFYVDRVASNRRATGQLIVDGSINAAKLSTGELITQSAQIADAVIVSAKIADLQVNTLKIAGDSVTTFASSFNPGTATGNGSYGAVVGVGVNVPSVGPRAGLLQVGWQHGYFNSTPTNFRIRWRQPPSLAEVIVTERQMGEINDTPSFFRTITMEPGYHEFFMDWSGANGNVQARDFNIAVLSRIR